MIADPSHRQVGEDLVIRPEAIEGNRAARPQIRLSNDNMTPLGRPVVPEV